MKQLDKKNIEDILALTPMQEGMLFHFLKESQSNHYFVQLSIDITGGIDVKLFERAWNTVIENNEMLRVVFQWEKLKKPAQVILKKHKVNLKFYDLSALTDGFKRKQQVEKIKGDDRNEKFDLQEVPFRIILSKLARQSWVLIISYNHIIFDGWSTGIILKEFVTTYSNLFKGRTPSTPMKAKFKEFIRLNQDKVQQEEEEKFWENVLEGADIGDYLEFSLKKKTTQSLRISENYQTRIDKNVKEKLEHYVKHFKITMAALLYGAWGILLHKYNNKNDVIIGTTVSGRRAPIKGIENMVGLFINTIPLRIRSHSRENISAFLSKVNDALREREAFEMSSLVHIKKYSDINANEELFNTVVVIENYPLASLLKEARGTFSLDSYSIFEMTHYDLALGITASDDIVVDVYYQKDLFNREMIIQLSNHYISVIKNFITSPDQVIPDIELISVKEKKQLLVDFNRTDADYPKEKTIHRLFEEQVEKEPDRIAVLGQNLEQKAESRKECQTPLAMRCAISYRELNKKSNWLGYLLHSRGVGRDTIVAMILEPSLEMISAILAILKAGGTYLPINPDYPRDRINFMLEDGNAFLLLTQKRLNGALASPGNPFLSGQAAGTLENKPVHFTGPRPQISNFDSLPIPDRSLVNYDRYNRYIGQAMVKNCISLQATRGCPYNCAYCHKIWPKTHVLRSAQHIFDEVKLYYDMGVRRFAFIDDIFNLNRKNTRRFFRLIIEKNLDVHLFFPNGLRGDLLTEADIDLMVRAGTINVALALETASPRLQKMIGKHLNLEKLKQNLDYFCQKYPQVILELFTMHGFPTETQEEAMMTLDFIKSIKWLHFPYLHVLKIYPNTNMAKIAIENGIPETDILKSAHLAYHQLPDTLPFERTFTLQYQSEFLDDYFFSKERFLHVLPYQMRVLSEDEIVQKYDSYLPVDIHRFSDLLRFADIGEDELVVDGTIDQSPDSVLLLNKKLQSYFAKPVPKPGALRVLLLDLSQFFSHRSRMLYDVAEPPLGLMYLLSYLNRKLKNKINGKIAKSRIDFDNYPELKLLLEEFKPEVIGIRTLSFYKTFFHKTIAMIRQWGFDVPIIAGGPYATSESQTILQDSHVDLVVVGEGEITFCEIIEKIIENNGVLPGDDILAGIPGIAFVPHTGSSNKIFTRERLFLDKLEPPGTSEPEGSPGYLSLPGDTAYIIYTSGTTGKPKGVMIQHQNVVRLMKNDRNLFDFNCRDTWTMFHSYGFDFSVWEMYGALLYGGKLVLIPKMTTRDPGILLRGLKEEAVTVLNQTPSAFYRLIEEELILEQPQLVLRYVIFGGEALKPGKLSEWKKRYPQTRLINMFGITETTVHVTFKELTFKEIDLNTSNIGKPIPTLKTYVMDRNLKLLPIGVPGELCVAGEGVAKGYLNRPELTAEKFIYSPGFTLFYRSGDRVKMLSDGDMIYLGRLDTQVKIRGFRVELGEIENRLLKNNDIKDAVIITQEDDQKENQLHAFIVSDKELVVPELRAFLTSELPDYMIPAYFTRIKKIPLTSSGKVDKKSLVLLDSPSQRAAAGGEYISPSSEIEKTIAGIWKELLGVDKVSKHDNFFDMGGNSLSVIRLNSQLKKVLKKDIPIVTLFNYPTISSLALHLSGGKRERTVVPLVKAEGWKKGSNKRKEIAVIGMSGRFPGAKNLDEFWSNLKRGVESITFLNEPGLNKAGMDSNIITSDNHVPAKGILPEMEYFDASFFGYTPAEAELMDPQIRILHECVWDTLEDAGYNPEDTGSVIGLYAGATINPIWLAGTLMLEEDNISQKWQAQQLADKDYLCSRIAYKLNLSGPIISINTACSTSLVAIDLACQGLLDGRCSMALAGGVSITLHDRSGYIYQEGMIMSPDGHCRAFDARAGGIVGGNGAGAVLLKPLEVAIKDGDHIYAVIKGTAINNDGIDRAGYTAPSVKGQAAVIKSALERAQVEPESIGYIETHGTGTTLGDPIEIRALEEVFNTGKKSFCAIGSVKTNLGHLDAAAGVAGFIKVVLALKNRLIPPTINFEIPNPGIDFINSPFYVNTTLQPWKNDGLPLTAGVSSFGIGGTNAHVILEEALQGTRGFAPLADAYPSRDYQLILLSARTPSALERMTENLSQYLKQYPETNLADVAYTLQVGRKAFRHRWMTVCSTVDEAIDALISAGSGETQRLSAPARDKHWLTETGRLWLQGHNPDWKKLYSKQQRYRVALPTYPFERHRYWIENDGLTRGTGDLKQNSRLNRRQDISGWFYVPSWKRSNLVQLPLPEIPPQSHLLVFLDDTGLGTQLVNRLEKENFNITVVKRGCGFEKKGSNQLKYTAYTIRPDKKSDYQRLFKQLKPLHLNTIIHLWNVTGYSYNPEDLCLKPDSLEEIEESGFYSLLYIAWAIGELKKHEEISIKVISNHLHDVTGEELLFPPKATILGAVKTIPQEFSNLHCQGIDIEYPEPGRGNGQGKLLDHLLREIRSKTPGSVVAYRGNHRWVQFFEPIPLTKSSTLPRCLREKGVYLITGGLGGMGLEFARYLAKTVHARLILVGRSPFPPKNHWDEWLNSHDQEDLVSGKIKKIRELGKMGGDVVTARADVASPEQVKEVIELARKTYGEINGIIHGAGIADEAGVILHRSKELTHRVLAPKIYGTLVLDYLCKDFDLDFFILCSSLSSVTGTLGQVGYSAANSFLDAFAYYKNASLSNHPTRIVSINWDLWKEVGMGVNALERIKEKGTGLDVQAMLKGAISPREGSEVLKRVLDTGFPQVAISVKDLVHIQSNPMAALSSHYQLLPGIISGESSDESPDGETNLEIKLQEIWKKHLGVKQVKNDDDFYQLGGDSLKAIILIGHIQKIFNVNISIVDFLSCPTINNILKLLGKAKRQSYMSIKPTEQKEYYPLSSPQKKMYFLQVMNPGSTAYNVSVVYKLEGKIDVGKLEDVFVRIIERHESFRTSFHSIDGIPIQRINHDFEFKIEYSEAREWNENMTDAIINMFVQPFDLARAPLLRVGLIKIGQRNYIFIFHMHHIIVDGTSTGVLAREFMDLANGKTLPTLHIQYKDFCQWQNKIQQSGQWYQQEIYWKKEFAGQIPKLTLPLDYPRPRLQSFEGNSIHFSLSEQVTRGLKKIARQEDTTLYTVLLALFKVLLSRISGQEEILVGTPITGRRHPDLQQIIGFFLATLVIKSYPSGEKNFRRFLQEVKKITLEAFENQDYPFEELVGDLAAKRDASRNPLFDALFIFQNMEIPAMGLPGLDIKTYYYYRKNSVVDLTLVGEEMDNRLFFSIEYCTKLFKEETIAKIIEIFTKINRFISKNMDAKIKNIEIEPVPAAARHKDTGRSSLKEIEFNI